MGPFIAVGVVNQVAQQVKLPDGSRIHDMFRNSCDFEEEKILCHEPRSNVVNTMSDNKVRRFGTWIGFDYKTTLESH